ncbi:Hypothetical protein CINCED_3A002251 [Cinara cedri]|uniref:Uncharacterized protein n=1 Tax=Cinara cedri TaxID=506608 RepID=A0A5E4M7K5_9HEMI|nr:Hypothetical protein CINCED_3A002251 [Cinara cedri]
MNSRNIVVSIESKQDIVVHKTTEMISQKRSFEDAESITKDELIDPNQSKNVIKIKRFKNSYYNETEPEKLMLSHSVEKLCNRVSVLPNEHGENKDFSLVYTRKRGSSVSDEQCSSNKKVKLEEIDDKVIVKRRENTIKLTSKKNLEENTVRTSNKPRLLTALLLNGNLSSIVNIDEQKCNINNTCAFDSIATFISRAFLDNSAYTNFVDANSSSEFLNFCKSIAFRDSAHNLNLQPVKILKRIFNEDSGVSNLKINNCECNIMKVICDLFKEYPSAKDHIQCSNNSCKNTNTCRNNSTIILDVKKLEHLKNLEGTVKEYAKLRMYNCGRCSEKVVAKRVLSRYLFIETDQVERTSQFTIADFPP